MAVYGARAGEGDDAVGAPCVVFGVEWSGGGESRDVVGARLKLQVPTLNKEAATCYFAGMRRDPGGCG
ncbi:hypothetical protein J1614_007933 [Plenodomus biglobosus]|nr:hypothetical protein J1614_007933 [Plenodomus biglobosus]